MLDKNVLVIVDAKKSLEPFFSSGLTQAGSFMALVRRKEKKNFDCRS